MALSDEAREAAKAVVAAMPPWSDEALAELARIADSAPRPDVVPDEASRAVRRSA